MIKRSYKLTTVMGIPIKVHLTLIIVLPFIAAQFKTFFVVGSFFWSLLCAVMVFMCIGLHELGHSWVAIRKGCQVREIMLLPLGGIAKMSHIPSRPMDEFLMAAAGPATSAVLALLCYLTSIAFAVINIRPLYTVFGLLAWVNLVLCLFNLLPSFPMDGGRIFRAFMTPRLGRLKATALAARIGRIMAVLFGIYALFHGQFLLLLIAIFIYNAAGAEYRAVYAQHMIQDWSTVEPQADIHVSPPPYARTAAPTWKRWKNKTNSFFNDLFKNWK